MKENLIPQGPQVSFRFSEILPNISEQFHIPDSFFLKTKFTRIDNNVH